MGGLCHLVVDAQSEEPETVLTFAPDNQKTSKPEEWQDAFEKARQYVIDFNNVNSKDYAIVRNRMTEGYTGTQYMIIDRRTCEVVGRPRGRFNYVLDDLYELRQKEIN